MNGKEIVSFCQGGEGRALLEYLSSALEDTNGDLPAVVLRAKKRLSDSIRVGPELLSVLADLAAARRKAAQRFAWADEGFFTTQALEQSSHPAIAAHHALPFEGCATLCEIGAGVGIDTIALAQTSGAVTALEPDPLRAAFCEANLRLRGITNVTVISETAQEHWSTARGSYVGVWADPARRAEGRRIHDPRMYSPPLDWLIAEIDVPVIGIKIGPGAEASLPLHWGREWIGYRDECREQVLWRGVAREKTTCSLIDVSATVGSSSEEPPVTCVDLEQTPISYLVEPHAALIAANLIRTVYAPTGIRLIDPHIAYGVSERAPASSPWYRVWRVEEHFPYSKRAVDEAVERKQWGPLSVVKKRGFPSTADELHAGIRWIEGSGSHGVVCFARVGERHHVFLCAAQPRGGL